MFPFPATFDNSRIRKRQFNLKIIKTSNTTQQCKVYSLFPVNCCHSNTWSCHEKYKKLVALHVLCALHVPCLSLSPLYCHCYNSRHHQLQGPEHTGHFVQPHVAAHCGGPEHTRATCGGDMYVMYANALYVAGTSHSLSHTWATNCSVLAKAWK